MGYTLIICEKPNASQRIAAALSGGKAKKLEKGGAPYYRFERDGKEIVVAPAVGHLFVLTEANPKAKWKYPVFDVKWVPTIEQKSNKWATKYFRNMESLARSASEFVSACDFDIEGSVIAWNIIRFICKAADGKRMKFSTLTPADLVEAYENASPQLDFPQIEAGLARHHMDWLFGINLSRALTLALEHSGGYWVLSTGRVQGPTLRILEERQREIEAFKSKPYWEINLHALVDGKTLIAGHVKDRFWKKEEADSVLKKCKGRDGHVKEVEKKQVKQKPPVPFDLTSLQREAYSRFGYSPKQTLDYAQHLYENALISYPRTSSQKLPPKIGYRDILKKLSSQLEYGELARKLLDKPNLKPNEGKKTDSAHPAIFPTGHRPTKLASYHKKVYDMIVRRFMAVFGEPAIREQTRVVIGIGGEDFVAHGIRTIRENWMEFYRPYLSIKEQILPDIQKGDAAKNKKLEMLEKETEPPNRYTQASILKEMEEKNLGTKATRAQILQTLYDRSYIKGKSIVVTELGESVINALERHSPEIISVELTRRFEQEMEAIEAGKLRREDVIKEAERELEKILDGFKQHEKDIGTHILKAVREYEKEIHTVGTCNKCGEGTLRIIHSHRTGKRFVGCSKYPKCHNSFPLPQHGFVQAMPTLCKCGLHLIEVRVGGKRPWRFCVRCGFDYKDKKTSKKRKTKTKS
ncbi:MAG: DNA topoisomerase I [Candidatus Aenigmatarchaeota archaeon]|nr:MAG: DNA topoisomerase I [Candidatus Aenigmarchaeota archaeon]